MIKNILNWCFRQTTGFRDFSVVKMDVTMLHNRIAAFEKRFKEETTIAVNVSPSARHGSFIIVVGQHRQGDFINCYSLSGRHAIELDEEMRELEKRGHVACMDTPPSFKGISRRRDF